MSKAQRAKSSYFVSLLSGFGVISKREKYMKKILMVAVLLAVPYVLVGCAKKCEVEPIVEQNHKLIVPPNFGNMPK